MKEQYTIGIDPDVDASGVAIYNSHNHTCKLMRMDFWQLTDFIRQEAGAIEAIIIEAGWLNEKSNFHSYGKGEGVAARIGKNVGANHQIGKLLCSLCEKCGLAYVRVKPHLKKLTPEYFNMSTGLKLKKKDQDIIDAWRMLVIYVEPNSIEKYDV